MKASWLALVGLGAALGCSWLVDPRQEEPRCTRGDVHSRCPEGLECRAPAEGQEGRCERPCREDIPDICGDRVDNDCDGMIDEVDRAGRDTCGDGQDNDCDQRTDEGSDGDGDGFFWCGVTVADVTGVPAAPDCDDRLRAVHPGAPELCDGRDNDCDDVVDEALPSEAPLCPLPQECIQQRCIVPSCAIEGSAVQCGPNERCVAETGSCVALSSRCANVQCPDAEECDETNGTCRKKPRKVNGSPCADDDECESGACVDAAALRLAEGARVCGQACCNSAQCPPGQQCFASGTGARSCLPGSLLPPGAPRQCTTSEACAQGELCAVNGAQSLSPPFERRTAVVSGTCEVPAISTRQVGEQCSFDSECATNICTRGPLLSLVCSNPCGRSFDCTTLGEAVLGPSGAYCRFVDVALNGAADYTAVCVVPRLLSDQTVPAGTGRYGAECSSASDCEDHGCVGATSTTPGRCTPTCCHDTQCGPREDGQPVSCRPFAFGARYEMRCSIQ